MPITLKSFAKIALYALLGLGLIAAAAVFWLRYEFARVQAQGAQAQYWQQVPVKALAPDPGPISPCKEQYPHRRAWFGALHVHTSASYDASAFGSSASPDDAYRFARGEEMPLRLKDDPAGYAPPLHRINEPLDFMAVTDHAETLGESRLCHTPGSDAYDALVCRIFRGQVRLPVREGMQPIMRLATMAIFGSDRSVRVCGEDGSACRDQAQVVWQENQRSTESWHDKSSDCRFTTLHGYEYTLAEQSSNLHRNVIFKSAVVPQAPLSAKDARQPEQLWQWLRQRCINGSSQCDVLAIPHNSNWSSGRMWFPYGNRDLAPQQQRQYAALRAQLEPLAEILQTKGDSE